MNRGAPAAIAPPTAARSFVIQGNSFVKEGQPFRILAGSMRYWRNKRAEWAPKMQSMRALGLNAVLTPTNWAWHEPAEGC